MDGIHVDDALLTPAEYRALEDGMDWQENQRHRRGWLMAGVVWLIAMLCLGLCWVLGLEHFARDV
jgi:hypothetical protein